ncbi:hypothetical protein Rcae01_06338 [Novipirellula caenicola]|uniref:Uncharacterized protein n=1 Tax=Novipirellula caenicola TaxID=1536901 RepID=A0ABP9W2R7_9BACT
MGKHECSVVLASPYGMFIFLSPIFLSTLVRRSAGVFPVYLPHWLTR